MTFGALTLKCPSLFAKGKQEKSSRLSSIESTISIIKKNFDIKSINKYTKEGKTVVTQVIYEREINEKGREFTIRYAENSATGNFLYLDDRVQTGTSYDFRDEGADGLHFSKKSKDANKSNDAVFQTLMRDGEVISYRDYEINKVNQHTRDVLQRRYETSLTNLLETKQFNLSGKKKVERKKYKIEEMDGC